MWTQDKLDFEPDRCLHLRNKNSSCHECIDVCPSPEALKIKNGVILDRNKCIECMQCTSACPTNVFSDKDEKKQFGKIGNRKHVIFTCKENDQKVNGVDLPCLKQLNLSHLLIAGLKAEKISIFYNKDQCQSCKFYNESIPTYVERLVTTANQIFKPINNIEVQIISSYENDVDKTETEEIFSRRDLLQHIYRNTTEQSIDLITNLLPNFNYEKRKLSEKLPLALERQLLNYVIDEYNTVAELNFSLPNKLLKSAKLKISDNCTLCEKCTAFCPTGALQTVKKDGVAALTEDLKRCVDCGLCKEMCPEHAINYYETISIKDWYNESMLYLHEKKESSCSICGAPIYSGTLCAKCAKKKDKEMELFSFFN